MLRDEHGQHEFLGDQAPTRIGDRGEVETPVRQGHLDRQSADIGEVPQVVLENPDDPVSRAVELMREHAVRRLPVCQDGRPVGIVSIGDLAVEQDPRSALADISAAPANR